MNDVFGKSTEELLNKKLFLFDMDGTIYEDAHVYDGTLDLLNEIKNRGGKYVFITNNSSKSVKDYVDKVNNLGIEADKDSFFTSSQATILYLQENYAGKKVYPVGTKSFLHELEAAGINLVEPDDAEVLLVGFDTELDYKKWENACRILYTKDVPFIATNPDLACPTAYGFMPDCGSICGVLQNITKKEPTYIGKPKDTMVKLAMEMTGYGPEETVVIGDRLYTDIACGVNAGVTTVCVLTGEATVEDIKESDIKPTITLDSVLDMYKIIK